MSTHKPANRRRATAIIALFVVAVAGAAVLGWRYAREAPPHQGPIVVIAVDAMGADALQSGSAGGNGAVAALAADSVVFTRAYSHSTQRLPAFTSLLTGRLPFEHGVRDDGGFPLDPQVRTMADLLRNRGFATGGVASTFLLRRASGVGRGFGYYNADLGEPAAGQPEDERDGVQTYEAAEEWMRQQGGQRYFLLLDIERESLDAVIARLVADLKARQLYDDATLVLTADRASAGDGASIDETSIRVPLLVKQPLQEGAGRVIDVPVQHIDILPTLLDFVRAPQPGGLRGRSLRPLLDDEDEVLPQQPIYSESLEAAMRFGGYPVFALTTADARLMLGQESRVVALTQEARPDDARRQELLASLDALVADRTVPLHEAVPAADERPLAAAGYLDGLRVTAPPPTTFTQADQVVLVEAHRAAVRRVAAGDEPGAVAAFRAMIRTHPALPALQYQLAMRLLKAGRLTEALAALKTADTLKADDVQVASTTAHVALRAGQLADATAAAELALVRAEGDAPSSQVDARLAALQVALANGDAAAATTHATEIERLDSTLPLGDYVEGRVALVEQRYEDAVAALQNATRALQPRPSAVPDLALYLGDALAEVGRDTDAEAAYRQALAVSPGNVRAYASLATLYNSMRRQESFAQTVDELIEAVPTAEGYVAAVRLWGTAGDRAKATALRNEARRRFRGDPALAALR